MPPSALPINLWLCADLGVTSHADTFGFLFALPLGHTHVLELIYDVGRSLEDAESLPYGHRSTSFPFADDEMAIALLKRLMNTFLGDEPTPDIEWNGDLVPDNEWNWDLTFSSPDVHYDYVAAPPHYNFTPYVFPHIPPLNTHGSHYKSLEPMSLAFPPYHASPEQFYTRTYIRYRNINAKREYKCLMEAEWKPQRDISQGFLLSTKFSYKLPWGYNTSISSNLHYKTSSRITFASLQV